MHSPRTNRTSEVPHFASPNCPLSGDPPLGRQVVPRQTDWAFLEAKKIDPTRTGSNPFAPLLPNGSRWVEPDARKVDGERPAGRKQTRSVAGNESDHRGIPGGRSRYG